MKLALALCTIILASTASAAAMPQPEADPFCHRIGEPCSKVKRAAEAEAFCHRIGEPCSKVKRAADALAEAFAEPKAAANADTDANAEAFCHRIGEPCSKAKRAADALAAAVAEAQPNPVAFFEALQMRDAFPTADASADAGMFNPPLFYSIWTTMLNLLKQMPRHSATVLASLAPRFDVTLRPSATVLESPAPKSSALPRPSPRRSLSQWPTLSHSATELASLAQKPSVMLRHSATVSASLAPRLSVTPMLRLKLSATELVNLAQRPSVMHMPSPMQLLRPLRAYR